MKTENLTPKGIEQSGKVHVEWMIGALDRMLEFGIPSSQVKSTLRTLSTRHNLSPDQEAKLTNFMDNRLDQS